MGRKWKKDDPKVRAAIVRAMVAGLGQRTAAESAGISRSTLQKWLEEDDSFSVHLKKAVAEAKVDRAERLIAEDKPDNITGLIYWLKTRTEEFREVKPAAEQVRAFLEELDEDEREILIRGMKKKERAK